MYTASAPHLSLPKIVKLEENGYNLRKLKLDIWIKFIKFKLKNWPYVSSCTPQVLPIALSQNLMSTASAPHLSLPKIVKKEEHGYNLRKLKLDIWIYFLKNLNWKIGHT
jgi:hypothetical protein